MAIRVLIVDDHTVVTDGLRAVLAGTSIEVTGVATTRSEAIRMVQTSDPQVIVLDIVLGAEDGFQLYGQLYEARPDLPVILYTAYDNPRFVARAASLGASGFVHKSEPISTLVQTIEAAASGRPQRVRRPAHRILGNPDELDVRIEAALTEREHQVLEKMADGMTNKEIAQVLGISYETVKEHVQHILQKVGVSDRTQAAVWAVRRGII